MVTYKKEINSNRQSYYDKIKQQCQTEYPDVIFVNNFYLTCEKILEMSSSTINLVECGVFNGGTLIPVTKFSKNAITGSPLTKQVNITGIDSFRGFPDERVNPIDKFDTFKMQLDNGIINQDYYNKAKERCFRKQEVLDKVYFDRVTTNIFDFAKDNQVNLLKGYFDDVLPTYNHPIDILYLDCDLYDSYLSCLNNLYDNIVEGGCIIFDEYFSYKYPGARVAIDEFFEDKPGYFEQYNIPADYERWCYVKDTK